MGEARTMSTREFLHGGYRAMDGPVIVLSGSDVAFVAFPGTSAIEVAPPQRFRGVVEAPVVRPVTAVPKPSQRKAARR